MATARCLCGEVSWELGGPFSWMTHCHCSRCRKAHGATFATYVAGPAAKFSLKGASYVKRFATEGGSTRCFCGQCGSVTPGDAWGDLMFVPAGNFDGDIEARPKAHIFAASKPSWSEIQDGLPQFDTYPPGIEAPVLADRAPLDPEGAPRGSCLCGAVTYVLTGPPERASHCHCARCRRARSAAHASNVKTNATGVRYTRGQELLQSYKMPDAKYFTQTFCKDCGSPMPRTDASRNLTVIPMGSFDDDPGIRPQSHIFVDSAAPWDVIADDLPRYAEYPPS